MPSNRVYKYVQKCMSTIREGKNQRAKRDLVLFYRN